MPIKRGWRSRGRLPHADFSGLTQAVTFRLADALPASILGKLRREVADEIPDAMATERRSALLRARLQDWLDAGHGSCLLGLPEARTAMMDELRRHDGERYRLDAFVVMPNHVHVLVGVRGMALGSIVQTWKGASARRINAAIGSGGSIWQREYFDRFIRDDEHAIAALRHIAANPEPAGIGGRDWPGLWVRDGLRDLLAAD